MTKQKKKPKLIEAAPAIKIEPPEKCDLYFAYGSNLNMRQMLQRCPNSEAQGKFFAPRGRLIFRGVADVINSEKSDVPGGLWRLGQGDEAKLDRFEGFDPDFPEAGAYRKGYLWFKLRSGKQVPCLFYRMNRKGILPPSKEYLGKIVQGYKDFDLPAERLNEAVEHSWAKRNETRDIREWRNKRGYRELGRLTKPVSNSKVIDTADDWFNNDPKMPAGYKVIEAATGGGVWRLIAPGNRFVAASTDPYELVKQANKMAEGSKRSIMKTSGVIYGD